MTGNYQALSIASAVGRFIYKSAAYGEIRDLFALFASITVIRAMSEHISSAGHVSYWHWAQLITSHPTMNTQSSQVWAGRDLDSGWQTR